MTFFWRWSRRRWVAYLALVAMLLSVHHAADAFLKPFPGAMNHEIEALMLARLSRMGIAADSAAGQATIAGLSSAGVDLAIGAGALLVAGTPIGWGGLLIGAAIAAAGTYALADADKVKFTLNPDKTVSPLADGHTHFPALEPYNPIDPNPCFAIFDHTFGAPSVCASTAIGAMHALAQWYTKLTNGGARPPPYIYFPADGYGGVYVCGLTRLCSVFHPTTEYWDVSINFDAFRHKNMICDDGATAFGDDPGHEFDNCMPLDNDAFLVPNDQGGRLGAYDYPGTITEPGLDEPVSPWVLAKLLNKLWSDASARTGYAGVPYSLSDPITEADAAALKTAKPADWPTVRDLTALLGPNTVAGQQNMTVPIAGTAPTSGTGGATAPGATTTVKLDLGVAPTVAEPTLPETTIDKIIDPTFGYFPSVKAMQLNFASGVCPRPGFDVWNKHWVIESHCAFLENFRAEIGALFLAVWTICAGIVLLKA